MTKRYKYRKVSIAGEAKIQSDRKFATSDRMGQEYPITARGDRGQFAIRWQFSSRKAMKSVTLS